MFKVETSSELFLMNAQGPTPAGVEAAAASSSCPVSPEAALVAAVRGGDREAFARLYGLYSPMVHGILLARVPYAEVGDLVQDVFLVAFRKLASLRQPERFGPWVAMITRNRAMDFYRRTRETEELHEEMAHAERPTAEAAEALEAIRALPEAYR